ncbi:MAG: hypothetical protein HN350_17950 [Phycisphaerales bacterium]|jgi:hypothetical protein|nr:hypothetical protein [Phycisphaerales bacterium]
MKTTLWSCVIFGAAVALSAGIAAGGVGDLTYVKTAQPGATGGGVNMLMRTVANPAAVGLTHPKAMATAKGAQVAVAMDCDDAKSDTLDLARIDMSGKGDFAKAVTVKLTKSPSRNGYTVLYLKPQAVAISKDGKKIPVLLSARYYKYKTRPRDAKTKPVTRISASASIQMAAQGECKFGDSVRKVFVIDRNRNMILGDVITRKSGTREYKQADYCRIADAKGTFSTSYNVRFVQMGQPIQIDGNWFTLASENMKITAAPMTGGLGKLKVDAPRWECMLMRDGMTLNISGQTEAVNVPAGKYTVRSFRLYKQAGTTKPSASIYGSSSKPLTITAGKATSFSAGKGLTAIMSSRLNKGKVRFAVTQSDASGSRIRSIYGGGGKRPTAPQIEVVNKTGKVIYLAKLAYG